MRPQLSLCMIVKNERQLLPACLDSVQGLVDEWIFVDTGSQDGTPEYLAQRLPQAQILSHPWQDDFSLARNVALRAATGKWILVLDADEQLSLSSRRSLQQLMRQPPVADGYLCLRIDYDAEQKPFAWHFLHRLFVNQPDLCYVGRIHERPCRGAGQLLQAQMQPEIVIRHDCRRAEAPEKLIFYQRLLTLARQQEPSPLLDFHWATLQPIRESVPATERLAILLQILESWEQPVPEGHWEPLWARPSSEALILEIQHLMLACDQVERMLAWFPRWQHLSLCAESWATYGLALHQAGQHHMAEKALLSSLDPYYPAHDPAQGWDSWRPLYYLSEIYAQQARQTASLSCALQALLNAPEEAVRQDISAYLEPLLIDHPQALLGWLYALRTQQQEALLARQYQECLALASCFLSHHLELGVFQVTLNAAWRLQAVELLHLLQSWGQLLWPQVPLFRHPLPPRRAMEPQSSFSRLYQALLPPMHPPRRYLDWQASGQLGSHQWQNLTDAPWPADQVPESGWHLQILRADMLPSREILTQVQALMQLGSARLDVFEWRLPGLHLRLQPLPALPGQLERYPWQVLQLRGLSRA